MLARNRKPIIKDYLKLMKQNSFTSWEEILEVTKSSNMLPIIFVGSNPTKHPMTINPNIFVYLVDKAEFMIPLCFILALFSILGAFIIDQWLCLFEEDRNGKFSNVENDSKTSR